MRITKLQNWFERVTVYAFKLAHNKYLFELMSSAHDYPNTPEGLNDWLKALDDAIFDVATPSGEKGE